MIALMILTNKVKVRGCHRVESYGSDLLKERGRKKGQH
jgi:hypothetical protein